MKIKTLIDIIKIYKSWEIVLLDGVKLLNEDKIIKLRNGLKFNIRCKEKDSNIITEVMTSGIYFKDDLELGSNPTIYGGGCPEYNEDINDKEKKE